MLKQYSLHEIFPKIIICNVLDAAQILAINYYNNNELDNHWKQLSFTQKYHDHKLIQLKLTIISIFRIFDFCTKFCKMHQWKTTNKLICNYCNAEFHESHKTLCILCSRIMVNFKQPSHFWKQHEMRLQYFVKNSL